jgi:hypothetical protein
MKYKEGIMKKSKKYLAILDLTYNYADSMDDDLFTADSVKCEITSWLEDLGFSVDIRLIEDKEI